MIPVIRRLLSPPVASKMTKEQICLALRSVAELDARLSASEFASTVVLPVDPPPPADGGVGEFGQQAKGSATAVVSRAIQVLPHCQPMEVEMLTSSIAFLTRVATSDKQDSGDGVGVEALQQELNAANAKGSAASLTVLFPPTPAPLGDALVPAILNHLVHSCCSTRALQQPGCVGYVVRALVHLTSARAEKTASRPLARASFGSSTPPPELSFLQYHTTIQIVRLVNEFVLARMEQHKDGETPSSRATLPELATFSDLLYLNLAQSPPMDPSVANSIEELTSLLLAQLEKKKSPREISAHLPPAALCRLFCVLDATNRCSGELWELLLRLYPSSSSRNAAIGLSPGGITRLTLNNLIELGSVRGLVDKHRSLMASQLQWLLLRQFKTFSDLPTALLIDLLATRLDLRSVTSQQDPTLSRSERRQRGPPENLWAVICSKIEADPSLFKHEALKTVAALCRRDPALPLPPIHQAEVQAHVASLDTLVGLDDTRGQYLTSSIPGLRKVVKIVKVSADACGATELGTLMTSLLCPSNGGVEEWIPKLIETATDLANKEANSIRHRIQLSLALHCLTVATRAALTTPAKINDNDDDECVVPAHSQLGVGTLSAILALSESSGLGGGFLCKPATVHILVSALLDFCRPHQEWLESSKEQNLLIDNVEDLVARKIQQKEHHEEVLTLLVQGLELFASLPFLKADVPLTRTLLSSIQSVITTRQRVDEEEEEASSSSSSSSSSTMLTVRQTTTILSNIRQLGTPSSSFRKFEDMLLAELRGNRSSTGLELNSLPNKLFDMAESGEDIGDELILELAKGKPTGGEFGDLERRFTKKTSTGMLVAPTAYSSREAEKNAVGDPWSPDDLAKISYALIMSRRCVKAMMPSIRAAVDSMTLEGLTTLMSAMAQNQVLREAIASQVLFAVERVIPYSRFSMVRNALRVYKEFAWSTQATQNKARVVSLFCDRIASAMHLDDLDPIELCQVLRVIPTSVKKKKRGVESEPAPRETVLLERHPLHPLLKLVARHLLNRADTFSLQETTEIIHCFGMMGYVEATLFRSLEPPVAKFVAESRSVQSKVRTFSVSAGARWSASTKAAATANNTRSAEAAADVIKLAYACKVADYNPFSKYVSQLLSGLLLIPNSISPKIEATRSELEDDEGDLEENEEEEDSGSVVTRSEVATTELVLGASPLGFVQHLTADTLRQLLAVCNLQEVDAETVGLIIKKLINEVKIMSMGEVGDLCQVLHFQSFGSHEQLQPLVATLSSWLGRRMSTLIKFGTPATATQVTSLVLALDRSGVSLTNFKTPVLVTPLKWLAMNCLDLATPWETYRVLSVLGKHKARDATLADALVRAALKIVPRLTPSQIAETIFALARLGAGGHPLIADLADYCIDHSEDFFSGRDIVRTMQGFSRMDHRDRGIYHVFGKRLLKRPIFHYLGRTEISCAFGAFGEARYLDPDIFFELQKKAQTMLHTFKAPDLALTIFGHAQLHLVDNRMYDALAECCKQQADDFTPYGILMVVDSFGRIHRQYLKVVDALLKSLIPRLKEVDTRHLPTLMVKLVQMEYNHAEHWGQLGDHLATHIAQLDDNLVGEVCQCMQELNWREGKLLHAIGERCVDLVNKKKMRSRVARVVQDTMSMFLHTHKESRKLLSPIAQVQSKPQVEMNPRFFKRLLEKRDLAREAKAEQLLEWADEKEQKILEELNEHKANVREYLAVQKKKRKDRQQAYQMCNEILLMAEENTGSREKLLLD